MLILNIALLLAALILILLGAELFTNAVEHVGRRFSLSEGMVGSILAAVATATPETAVPLIAVFFGGAGRTTGETIATGAILGSPLMLVTLAMALMGLYGGLRRGWGTLLRPESSGLLRDLAYFSVSYVIACIALFIPSGSAGVRMVAGFALVFLYVYYIYNTMLASTLLVKRGHGVRPHKPLLLARTGVLPHPAWEGLQFALGLAFIIIGAKLFLLGIEQLVNRTGVGTMVLALLVIPVATETPEKLNSILWVGRGKDTLAFGNLTGAMVLQGTLLPAFGMQLASWTPSRPSLLAMGVTFAGTAWILLLTLRRRLTPFALLLNGLGYLLFFFLLTRA